MLEYSSQSEMISNSSVLNILKAYKDAWIPLTRSKKKPSFLERFKLKTTPIDGDPFKNHNFVTNQDYEQ